MKRKLSLLIVLVMLFQIVPLQIFADEVLTLDVSCDEDISELNADDEFTLNFAFKNNLGIASFAVVVEFPKDVISIVPFEDDDEVTHYIAYNTAKLTNTSFLSDNGGAQGTNGKIKVGFARTANAKNDFTFASITFKVLTSAKPDDYSITLNVAQADVMDKDMNELKYTYDSSIPFHIEGEKFSDDVKLIGAGTYTYGDTMNVGVTGAPTDATITYTVNDQTVAADKLAETIKNAGTYTISAKVEKDGFETKTFEAITVTVNPKEVSVSIPAVDEKTYDGKTAEDEIEKALGNATVTGAIEGDEVKASFQYDKDSLKTDANDDSYSVTVNVSVNNTNYKVKEAQVTLAYKINKREITVTADNASKKVGKKDPALTASITTGALVNGHTISYVVTRAEGETVGDYTITAVATIMDAEGNNVTGNYKIDYKPGTFSIVDKTLTEIKITTEPDKKAYIEDQKLDLTGMVVTASYDNETTEDITGNVTVTPAAGYTFTAEDAGKKTITVVFGDKTDTFDVTVSAKELTGITLDTTGVTKSFKVGTEFNYVNLKVTPVFNNSVTYEHLTEGYTVSTPDMNQLGEQTITVSYTYGGVEKTAEYKIEVVDKKLSSLSYSGDVKNVYVEGTKFDATNLVVTANYDNGTTATVTNYTITPDGELKTSDKFVTISYTEGEVTETCDITITVNEASVKDFVVKDYKKDYIEDQAFDTSKVVLTVTYDNGKTGEVTTGFTVSPATLKLGTKTVTITYAGKTADVTVNVAQKQLQRIEVSTSKTSYVDGDDFDLTKVTVYAYYDNFPEKAVKVSETFVSDVDVVSLKEAEDGKITVTITFEGKTDTLIITVDPCVATITTTVSGATTTTRFGSLVEAINNAEDGDTIEVVGDAVIDEDVIIDKDITIVVTEDGSLTQDEDADITVSEGSLTIENNSGDDVDLSINGEDVTVENGESTTVEPVEEDDAKDNFNAYYSFYLQMLQWRNRTFNISYKQTEGGTISGATSVRFSQSVTFNVIPDEGYEIADVTVNGKSVGAVKTYTIKNIKANTTVSATFNKIETEVETVEVEIVPEVTVWVNPFTDVKETDAFYAAVQYVYENGLFKGMSATEFAPDTTMNRAMFVTVLGRLTGVNVDDYTTVTFADCEADSWYAPYVEWAAQAGIVKGMSATEFAPYAEITVEQAVTILYRYMNVMGYDLSGADTLTAYTDAESVNDWALEAMQWAVACDVYDVTDTLAPQNAAARSLVAVMLYNLSNLLVK